MAAVTTIVVNWIADARMGGGGGFHGELAVIDAPLTEHAMFGLEGRMQAAKAASEIEAMMRNMHEQDEVDIADILACLDDIDDLPDLD